MEILFKRGNTAQNDAYTGPLGSITIDTQARKLRIHDGVNQGGKIVPNMDDLTSILTTIAGLAIDDIDGLTAALNGKADSSHSHAISDVTGLQTALDDRILSSLIGTVDGIASLDSSGRVPAAQLPSYVDDVLEYPDFASFPATGESGKLYIDTDTAKLYRWTGSVYYFINPTAGSADTAASLSTPRTIAASGDATWSVSFDGSTNVSSALTLSSTGVTAGTYTKVTVDAKGRVTAASSPTTLSGHGITDAAPIAHVGSGASAHAIATTSVNGFMSASDKTKLESITAGANNYTLPVATATILGGVKQGAGVTIAAGGAISADVLSVQGRSGAVVITPADLNLDSVPNYALATQGIAEIGESNTTLMSPLRTVQLLEAGNFTLDAGVLT